MTMLAGTAQLNTGAKIPVIGLGTAAVKQDDVRIAVTTALEVGYRHFDTARLYGSEPSVGQALNAAFKTGPFKRQDVFVTTKLWNTDHDDPVSALKNSLKNLEMDYVDLYLLHWPIKLRKEASLKTPMNPLEEDFLPLDIQSTWKALEQCAEMGLSKAIGISNFSCKKIEHLLSYAKIPPAVNQVEMHPMWQQKKLRDYCKKQGIHISIYSPLGSPNTWRGTNAVIESPIINQIAQKHGKSPAQVCIRWAIEQGVIVLTKSYNKERIAENFGVFDWSLTQEDHESIGKLEQERILRGDALCNTTTSPYRSLEELWDGEI